MFKSKQPPSMWQDVVVSFLIFFGFSLLNFKIGLMAAILFCIALLLRPQPWAVVIIGGTLTAICVFLTLFYESLYSLFYPLLATPLQIFETLSYDDGAEEIIQVYINSSGLLNEKNLYAVMPWAFVLAALNYHVIARRHIYNRLKPLAKRERPEDKKVSARKSRKVQRRAAAQGKGLLIGTKENGWSLYLDWDKLNEHTLIVGSTGSGKTVTMSNFMEAFAERGWPAIIVDGKGDNKLAKQVTEFAQAQGRKAYILTFNNNSNCTYNPFVCGEHEDLADMVSKMFDNQNEFYEEVGLNYLQSVFKALKYIGKRVDLVTLADYLEYEVISGEIERAVEDDIISEHQARKIKSEIAKQEKAIEEESSIGLQVRRLANSSIGAFFDTQRDDLEPVDLAQVIEENAIFYIALKGLGSPAQAASIGKTVINDIKNTLQTINQSDEIDLSDKRLLISLDEFSAFSGPQVEQIMKMTRDMHGACLIGTQTFADLMGPYKDDRLKRDIISNAVTRIIHNVGSPEDREEAAKVFGSEPSDEFTHKISEEGDFEGGTLRYGYDYKFTPELFDSIMQPGGGYIRTRYGRKPVETYFQSRMSWVKADPPSTSYLKPTIAAITIICSMVSGGVYYFKTSEITYLTKTAKEQKQANNTELEVAVTYYQGDDLKVEIKNLTQSAMNAGYDKLRLVSHLQATRTRTGRSAYKVVFHAAELRKKRLPFKPKFSTIIIPTPESLFQNSTYRASLRDISFIMAV